MRPAGSTSRYLVGIVVTAINNDAGRSTGIEPDVTKETDGRSSTSGRLSDRGARRATGQKFMAERPAHQLPHFNLSFTPDVAGQIYDVPA